MLQLRVHEIIVVDQAKLIVGLGLLHHQNNLCRVTILGQGCALGLE